MGVCGVRTGIKFVSSHKIPLSSKFDTSKFKTNFPGFAFTNLENGFRDYIDDNSDIKKDRV